MKVSRKTQRSLDRVAKGYTVADDDDDDRSAVTSNAPLSVDATTPDLNELRRKYLGDDDSDSDEADAGGTTYDFDEDGADGSDAAAAEGDDESGLVTIKPGVRQSPQDASTRDRTAVISKDGRVIGLQG